MSQPFYILSQSRLTEKQNEPSGVFSPQFSTCIVDKAVEACILSRLLVRRLLGRHRSLLNLGQLFFAEDAIDGPTKGPERGETSQGE